MFFQNIPSKARKPSSIKERASATQCKAFQPTTALLTTGILTYCVCKFESLLCPLSNYFPISLQIPTLPNLLCLLQQLHSSDRGATIWSPGSLGKFCHDTAGTVRHPWVQFCLEINLFAAVCQTHHFNTCFPFLPGSNLYTTVVRGTTKMKNNLWQ